MEKPQIVAEKVTKADDGKALKELKQKHKVEMQVKENQVRTLKTKLESLTAELEAAQAELKAYESDVQQDLPLLVKQCQKLERQKKKDDEKIAKLQDEI